MGVLVVLLIVIECASGPPTPLPLLLRELRGVEESPANITAQQAGRQGATQQLLS